MQRRCFYDTSSIIFYFLWEKKIFPLLFSGPRESGRSIANEYPCTKNTNTARCKSAAARRVRVSLLDLARYFISTRRSWPRNAGVRISRMITLSLGLRLYMKLDGIQRPCRWDRLRCTVTRYTHLYSNDMDRSRAKDFAHEREPATSRTLSLYAVSSVATHASWDTFRFT